MSYMKGTLKKKKKIDFTDMINKATNIIQKNLYKSSYKYIIIDEYQDISKGEFQLIKSLLEQKPSTKIFCVGDDWQSIYAFKGCDVDFFTNFKEYFKLSRGDYERVTRKSFIECTYRFDNQLIDLSSEFILKNPNQIPKNLKSVSQSEEVPYSICKYSSKKKTQVEALKDIAKKSKRKNVSVLILFRYNFEIENLDKSFLRKKDKERY